MMLTAPELATIRALRAKGHSISEICQATGRGRATVHRSCQGVPMPYGPRKSGRQPKVNKALARQMLAEGATYRQIAARFRCAASAVHKALNAGGRS